MVGGGERKMATPIEAHDDGLALLDRADKNNFALLRLVLCVAVAMVVMGLASQVLAFA